MRRTILGVSISVLLAACMHAAPRDDAAPAPPAPPLDVSLLPALAANTNVPSLTFALNRPAYVAAFEVIPGRGVRLLYPYAPEQAQNPGGMNLVTETPAFFDDYLGSVLAVPNAAPTYTYIIASDEPLTLGALTQPAGLRNYFGAATFASYRASSFIDAVTSAVIPAGAPNASWASDMVVDWSNAPFGEFADATTSIECSDGRVLIVPTGYGSTMCPVDAVRTTRATVLAKAAPAGRPIMHGPTLVTAERPATNQKQVEPRRRPWWAGNPGMAWVGSLEPDENAGIFRPSPLVRWPLHVRAHLDRRVSLHGSGASNHRVTAGQARGAPAAPGNHAPGAAAPVADGERPADATVAPAGRFPPNGKPPVSS